MIAERTGVDMDEAFHRLRKFARDNNRGLTEVAEAMVAGNAGCRLDLRSPLGATYTTPARARLADVLSGRDLGALGSVIVTVRPPPGVSSSDSVPCIASTNP